MSDLCLDPFELRARLEEETEAALKIADDLAATVATERAGREASALAANYMQVRTLMRQLRRVLTAEVAG